MLTFNVQRIEAPMDPDDMSSEGLLGVIIRTEDNPDRDDSKSGPVFFTPTDLPLQVAAIYHNQGEGFDPHYHPPHERRMYGTPEMLLIVSGSYSFTIYTSRGVRVDSFTLSQGDIVVLVTGGHSAVSLEDGSQMFEVKVGPYLADRDKVRFKPKET